MKAYLEPKMDVTLMEKDIYTDIITESTELPPLSGDFGDPLN